MSSEQDTSSVPDRLLGQVKWFNNKAGYGFITVNDGQYAGKDIFVHYSTIRVTNSQYKYLVQGEYVEFNLVKSSAGDHEFQATDISGVKNGALMCETRRNNRAQRDDGDSPAAPRERPQQRRTRPAAPQTAASGDGDFTTVRRRTNNRPKKDRKPAPAQEA
jgi:cold shock protein